MSELNRYLKTSDYKRAIFLDQLEQLTEGDNETLQDAELDAEACIQSALTDEYDIELEFELGRSISEFSYEKEYLKGSYVVIDGRLSKANSYSNPSRIPMSQDYWIQLDESEVTEGFTADQYSQNNAYYVGDVVAYETGVYFRCVISNGVSSEYGDNSVVSPIIIRWNEVSEPVSYTTFDISEKYIVGDFVEKDSKFYECLVDSSDTGLNIYPDTVIWSSVPKSDWDSSTDYSTNEVEDQIFNESDLDYVLIDPSNASVGVSPSQSIIAGESVWKQINIRFYDRSERYERASGFDGYVIDEDNQHYFISEQDEVFVNSAVSVDEFLFTPAKDPRNRNIVNCMVHHVIYQLCSVVVPDNIPTVRITNFENVMEKLEKFSKMKANPNIPRKQFTYSVTDQTSGSVVEKTGQASRWVVSNSDVTGSSWEY